MQKHNVKIYSTPSCPNCAKAKRFFEGNNIEYTNIDIVAQPDMVKEMIEKSGQMGVPVIDINGKIIVGFQLGALKSLLDLGSKDDLDVLMVKGALIVDVRSEGEYYAGHNDSSVNIPLEQIEERILELPKDKPIILVCASGSRSGVAKEILEAKGFKDIYNGGSWNNIKQSEGGGVCPV